MNTFKKIILIAVPFVPILGGCAVVHAEGFGVGAAILFFGGGWMLTKGVQAVKAMG